MVSDVMPHLRHYVTPPLPGPHIVVNVSVVGVKGHGRYAVDHRPTLDTHHRNAQERPVRGRGSYDRRALYFKNPSTACRVTPSSAAIRDIV